MLFGELKHLFSWESSSFGGYQSPQSNPTYHPSELDNKSHFLLYYVYNEEIQRRHYEDIKETRTIRH